MVAASVTLSVDFRVVLTVVPFSDRLISWHPRRIFLFQTTPVGHAGLSSLTATGAGGEANPPGGLSPVRQLVNGRQFLLNALTQLEWIQFWLWTRPKRRFPSGSRCRASSLGPLPQRNAMGRVPSHHVRPVENAHPPIQMLADGHAAAGQRPPPSRPLDLP